MRWTHKTLVVSIVLAVSAQGLGFIKLANDGKRGLHTYTIEKMLRTEEDQIDLATGALLLSREWGTKKTLHLYRGKIDDMATDIIKQMEKERVPMDHRAIRVINDYLFRERGFRTVKTAENPNDLFLHNVIDKKYGYCLSLSVLYLSIGERLGLPLYGVVVPEHFFVRYDDGRNRYNIETTSGGAIAPDDHYITEFGVPEGDSIYMKNLTKVQTIGCFYNNLGNSYMDIGDIDTARSKLESAVAINPSLAEARSNLGNIYLRQGLPDDAIDQYLVAMEIIGEDAKIQTNLANAYNFVGDHAAAIEQYNLVLRLDGDYVEAYKGLANSYLRRGEFNKGIFQLKLAINKKPTDATLYKQMGDIYQQIKDHKEAIIQYQRALWVDRDLVSAHSALGFAYLQDGQADEAVRQFQRTIGLDRSDSNVYFGLGQAYNAMGNTRQEIKTYKLLLSLHPNTHGAILNLGNAYITLKQYDKAIEQYTRAMQIDPGDSKLRYNLGVAYTNKEMYDDAVEHYIATIEIDPRDGAAHHGLAYNYYMLKEKNLAKKHIRIAGQLGFQVNEQLLKALE